MIENYEKAIDAVMESTIREIGAVYFSLYVHKLIQENVNLSGAQKEALTNRITDSASWALPETQKSFRRFVLVALGIIAKSRPTSNSHA
jgi:hypothetical protein